MLHDLCDLYSLSQGILKLSQSARGHFVTLVKVELCIQKKKLCKIFKAGYVIRKDYRVKNYANCAIFS